jgi:1-acyl-sn-glycerol-3-phosphate acyltransferase
MEGSPPRRLAARRPLLAERDISPPGTLLPLSGHRGNWSHPLHVVRRAGSVLLWTLPCMAIQSICVLLPGRAKVLHARFYWAVVSRLLGVRVRMIGTPAYDKTSRPVVFVSNHSSWLDVPVLGGRLNGCFVSKDEVGAWPFVGTVARLGRTVFISRQRHATARERDAMRERLAHGDNLVLFPEGTTSDGSRVLPFRSSFFAIAEGPDPPLIQPVSVVYDRLDGLPTGRASRAIFAWYGDMDLATHFWRFAQHRGLRATILLHAPMDPSSFASRKALSHAVWQAVADGAATLRQNRPIEARAAGPDVAAGQAYA